MLITSKKQSEVNNSQTFLTSTFPVDVKNLQNCPIRTISAEVMSI